MSKKNLEYFAIDIETTSLDPDRGQILEIAVIFDQLAHPVDWPPTTLDVLHIRVMPRDGARFYGDHFAMKMNEKLIQDILHPEQGCHITRLSEASAAIAIRKFIGDKLPFGEPANFCGKNLGSFDIQFLNRLPGWEDILHRHRYIDIGNLALSATDRMVPDMKTSLDRVGLKPLKAHSAFHDAADVVRFMRKWANNQEIEWPNQES